MILSNKNKRMIKAILSIVICISIIGGMTIQSMYCAPVVIPLTSLIPIVGKILITAGVSYISYNAIFGESRRCIEAMSESVANDLRSMVANIRDNAVIVKDTVWNYVKSCADSNYDEGENLYYNTLTYDYVSSNVIYRKTAKIHFTKDGTEHTAGWEENPDGSATMYHYGVEVRREMTAEDWNDYVAVCFDITGTSSKHCQVKLLEADLVTYTGTYVRDGVTSLNTVEVLESEIVTGVENVIDNPDYIHGNDVTGENSFLINQDYADLLTGNPEAITDADITAELETYEGLTCDDVKAEEVPVISGIDEGLLQGILDSLTGIVSDRLAAIRDALTGAVSGTLEDIRVNTQEEEIENNNIFDFFISLLMILKQLVLIVLKFLVFIVVVRNIPAQSSLFDANTKAVIDYIHNQSLPIFNITFMQIINAFIGILVAVSIIRIINKNVRANL